jgi:hypothetical protein
VSRLFGPMRQLGYVVPDVRAAVASWVAQGVGPFFVEDDVALRDVVHDGEARGDVRIALACGNAGDVQIELIGLLDERRTMFHEFRDAHGGGLQHWASWPEDYDERLAAALDAGWVVGQEGDSVRGRWVYLRDRQDPTRAVELAEARPDRMRCYGTIRAAALDWDGRDPVRDGMP